MNIEIKSNDRVFVCGKTGSGKSHLVMNLIIPQLANVIIYDVKNDIELPGFDIFHEIQDFKKYPNRQRIIYRAKEVYASEKDADREFNRLCKQAYLRGNTTLYLDEIANRTGSNRICPYHDTIMRLGRSKGIGIINCTQRPRGVSNNIISQCNHFFIFKQSMETDLDKLAGICGEKIYEPLKEKHSFWYYCDDMDEPILCRPIKG